MALAGRENRLEVVPVEQEILPLDRRALRRGPGRPPDRRDAQRRRYPEPDDRRYVDARHDRIGAAHGLAPRRRAGGLVAARREGEEGSGKVRVTLSLRRELWQDARPAALELYKPPDDRALERELERLRRKHRGGPAQAGRLHEALGALLESRVAFARSMGLECEQALREANARLERTIRLREAARAVAAPTA